jgi:hypothetical protein
LISAGIGVTPVLSMLHALATEHSDREIWWRPRRTQQPRPLLRRRGPRAARFAPKRADPRVLQPSRPKRRRRSRLRQRRSSHCIPARRSRATAKRRGVSLWADTIHGRDQRRLGRDRPRRHPYPTPSRSGPHPA